MPDSLTLYVGFTAAGTRVNHAGMTERQGSGCSANVSGVITFNLMGFSNNNNVYSVWQLL